ncbi:MAG: hypothetical protein KatS3mg131_0457 [Candidatus Tectimicrobiota bacterium]|nr:MAG: hypothetical protein KatS3mg131_0457 [Candidatus Tectomicrobia bacterium]
MPDAEPRTPVTGEVEIEAVAWISRFVGGDGSSRKVFREPWQPGDTVRSVLQRFSARYPELHRALWDASGNNLGEHIEVLVNDAVLGIHHTLDSPVQAGDRLSLIGQYMGG